MKVLVGGQLIEYKDEGKGKVVLLLHGWGASLATFDLLVSDLIKKYRVIRFDFPGFGGSPKPDDSWGVGEYAALTGRLLQKLKIDAVHAVIGHSFGGRVIIKGIATQQFAANKAILIATAGIKPKKTMKKRVIKAVAKTGKLVTRLPLLRRLRNSLRSKLYQVAGATDYLHANDLKPIFLNTINEDLRSFLPQIMQPTLVVWGETDTETPLADGQLMEQAIPNSALVVIPDAGHFVYAEEPVKVSKIIREFL